MDPHGQQTLSPPHTTTDANAASVAFTPHFQVDGLLPDIALLSSDRIIFYAHRARLLSISTNAFAGTLLQHPQHPLALPEPSPVLNLVLHLAYNMSCLRFHPSFEATDAALASLSKYGVPNAFLAASAPLHALALSYAPYRPIDVYALAGQHRLEAVAVAASAHLLAHDLSTISDALTLKMGSAYLARLFNLHQARQTALKNIVLRPPAAHPPTAACGADGQQALTSAWAFASADLMWHALPNISTGALQSAFAQGAATIQCPDCKTMLHNRIAEVTSEWAAVKRTV